MSELSDPLAAPAACPTAARDGRDPARRRSGARRAGGAGLAALGLALAALACSPESPEGDALAEPSETEAHPYDQDVAEEPPEERMPVGGYDDPSQRRSIEAEEEPERRPQAGPPRPPPAGD